MVKIWLTSRMYAMLFMDTSSQQKNYSRKLQSAERFVTKNRFITFDDLVCDVAVFADVCLLGLILCLNLSASVTFSYHSCCNIPPTTSRILSTSGTAT